VLEWCRELKIKNVTFYALSLENMQKRPKQELDFLFMLAKNELGKILTDRSHIVHRNRVKTTFFGRLDLLPPDLQQRINQIMEMTKDYGEHTANFAMAYGGRQEIIEAAKKVFEKAGSAEDISEALFRENLYTNGFGDPDLIIRTGGEKRLSNFLPFQSVYSELAFTDTFWPELTKKEFFSIIDNFSKRERRFGK
jgi:tritrans,polycis-undecaprenyl-diphosphate synthase [geranylgeranyl-diphosphate specific]